MSSREELAILRGKLVASDERMVALLNFGELLLRYRTDLGLRPLAFVTFAQKTFHVWTPLRSAIDREWPGVRDLHLVRVIDSRTAAAVVRELTKVVDARVRMLSRLPGAERESL